MSAGTLTLTNNSAAVTGSGTAFNNELVAGDFIVATVGGITYTLPVKSIGSGGTQLVLVSKYSGPTQAGAAWQAVPRTAQNQITAELVAQTTAALRGLNYDKQNWQAVFSASGDITVILPDGSSFTGPSWKKIQDILALIDIDAVTQLANQVRSDAQQVSTDKGTAQTAAQSASSNATAAASAKTAAVAAQGKAVTAQTAAETAKAAAEAAKAAAAQSATNAANSAASIDTTNLLQKDKNLEDVPDKAVAREKLNVYSKTEVYTKTETYAKTETYTKTEVDNKSTATNARIGSAVIDAGSLTGNSQVVNLTNPFGASTPVSVTAEIQYNGVWCDVGWVYSAAGTFGVRAMYVEGQGIVVKTGAALSSIPNNNGHILPTPDNYKGPAPCRVLVRKISA